MSIGERLLLAQGCSNFAACSSLQSYCSVTIVWHCLRWDIAGRLLHCSMVVLHSSNVALARLLAEALESGTAAVSNLSESAGCVVISNQHLRGNSSGAQDPSSHIPVSPCTLQLVTGLLAQASGPYTPGIA